MITLTYQVHCRTGSLEISIASAKCFDVVHCRTGSLEKRVKFVRVNKWVHCRTGSLERNIIVWICFL